MLEVARESRGGIYLTIEEVAPHVEDSVEIVIIDEVFYQAGDLMIPARPDSGVDMRHGPSGPVRKPGDDGNDQDASKKNQGEDDTIEGKGDKVSETDLGALERDLLEYDFKETEDGVADETLMLIMPSSFMSPAKEEPPASLSPVT